MNSFLVIILTSSFILLAAAFIVDPINEKMSGFKLTQLNLGINNVSYWLSFYITHWVFFLFLTDFLFYFYDVLFNSYVFYGVCWILR